MGHVHAGMASVLRNMLAMSSDSAYIWHHLTCAVTSPYVCQQHKLRSIARRKAGLHSCEEALLRAAKNVRRRCLQWDVLSAGNKIVEVLMLRAGVDECSCSSDTGAMLQRHSEGTPTKLADR